jgi:transposase
MLKYPIKNFREDFPDDETCLEWLKNYLYPDGIHCEKCEKVTTHYKVKGRKSYSCQFCGHHVHPTAGTIYHKSSTPLTDWFYAVFLMASTRCGIAAKQLERELGVTYKTAWRMFHQIRSMLDESDNVLSGKVEIDETFIGGRRRYAQRHTKTIIAGAVERGGSVSAKVVPDAKSRTLIPFIDSTIERGSTIYSDEYPVYRTLGRKGFKHHTVRHYTKQWVIGEAHTNTIEGFWSLFKGGIKGVYKGRPEKRYLDNYINEYSFRYNRRFDETPMFFSFLGQIRKLDD